MNTLELEGEIFGGEIRGEVKDWLFGLVIFSNWFRNFLDLFLKLGV